jgi:cytochrome b561
MAILDALMLAAFVALSAPGGATGFVVHEWIGLAFIGVIALHVILSWRWVPAAVRRLRRRPDPRTRVNMVLNVALFTSMTVAMISGFIVSDYVSPALHLPTSDEPRWRNVHNMTASFLLAVVGLHVALNWTWIVTAMKRYFAVRRRPSSEEVVS